EIFFYSPRVEGVHLRGGKVARGGLRWSDRREDFRTEVLGLMKAQMVKNTVIVPVGAKGGFVPKRLPVGDRDAIFEEGVACYKQFICGLLDVADNLVDNTVVPPRSVVRHDDDDYYLVVAADKGTATFSDIANGVSKEYGFWLGDAFASGGSAGYDHKAMGITARGAWVSVKRHFREIGLDTQTETFTVAGIGDMSGDVFGNGMLSSETIRLQAAFNHLHIFLDPHPDPATSFAERKRLFELLRSTWADYDEKLISAGGGVFARSEKSIELSAEVRSMLGIKDHQLTPDELIRAILRMPVDLLWNGGIGTYVKAVSETKLDVGDRANDNVRVDGKELNCKVVGEGGNLGLTQLGRVEYALNGGRINTDFIDNSGGVDTSDREVNIKILLNQASQTESLTEKNRDKLLEGMTDEVAALVLRDNYLQTQAISLMRTQAAERLSEHAHLIRSLEQHAGLDRELEFLPDDEAIEERHVAGAGLTRPEMSVLLAYSKIMLYRDVIHSKVPEDPYLARELSRYFPAPLQKRYGDLMPEHRLRREIIATMITNSMINRMGPTFVARMEEETGAKISNVARAYTIARESFNMHSLWASIEALDNEVHANVQYSMMFETTRLLKHVTHWLLERQPCDLDIETCVAEYKPGVAELQHKMSKLLIGDELRRFQETRELYANIGVPDTLSERVASLQPIRPALDIVEVASRTEHDVAYVASVYFRLGTSLSINWLRDQIENLIVEGHWQATARGTLRENLYSLQRGLTTQIIRSNGQGTPGEAVLEWFEADKPRISHAQQTLDQMRTADVADFASLSVAVQEIRKLAEHLH
ncbi:MAG: NAD-glutamate dehydrogenase domain-containing protein, partial [Gammaproteobacteria bacterium]